ncbi:MAG: hypothetical protein SGILL_004652, partial [Bacillariaceae sp.]
MLIAVSALLGHWLGHSSDSTYGFDSVSLRGESSSSGVIVPSRIPPQIVIDQVIERSKDPTPLFVLEEGSAKIAVGHPAFENIPEQYQPKKEWKDKHFPYINILGLPKAGTSHLYQILTTHAQMSRFSEAKEFYFNMDPSHMEPIMDMSRGEKLGTPESNEFIQDFMKLSNDSNRQYVEEALYNRKWTVNGGLDPRFTLLQSQYLGRHDTAKYIILLRDPADWLWAGYNFWLHPEHEDALPAAFNDWASAPLQYRSPEMFHEYMRAGERNWFTRDLLGKFRDSARNTLQMLLASTSKENILVLKSEDFAPHKVKETGVMQKLGKFLDVSEDLFDDDVVFSYGNCGDAKGESSKCTKATNAYKITGRRSMFEETRDLVYLQFAE